MNDQDRQDQFSELLARHQGEIYSYIFAIVRNWPDTNDLFQCVCLVLWSKFDSFMPGTSFFAWARRTAQLEVRKFLTRKPLPTHVSEQLLDTLAAANPVAERSGVERGLAALRRCKAKLGAADSELLELRYIDGLSTVEIGDRMQRLQPSVSRSLNRIRRWLFECIETELAKQERSDEELP
jgi:RNA polymerase sigma-70 factor, ECF subfamily